MAPSLEDVQKKLVCVQVGLGLIGGEEGREQLRRAVRHVVNNRGLDLIDNLRNEMKPFNTFRTERILGNTDERVLWEHYSRGDRPGRSS